MGLIEGKNTKEEHKTEKSAGLRRSDTEADARPAEFRRGLAPAEIRTNGKGKK